MLAVWNYAAFVAVDHDFTFQAREFPPDAGKPIIGCMEHGWPWAYARREEMAAADWNLNSGLLEFYPLALLGDAAVALVIAAAAGWLYERWRRKRRRWYQAGLGTLLVAMLLCGWVFRVVRQHRHAHEVLEAAEPVVAQLRYGAQPIGPFALGGYVLPTRSQHAKPLFVCMEGYAIPRDSHPGPAIASIIALDPTACRLSIDLNPAWQSEGVLDWVYKIPVQDVRCRVEPGGTLEPLTRLPQLRYVWINWPTDIDNALLATLGELPELETLAINGAGTQELKDEDVAFLESLINLRVLAIGSSQLTGDVLKDVAAMPRLRTLCLPGVALSDDDLQRIAKMTALRRLEIDSARVSPQALEQLERSCPRLQVVRLDEPP